MATIEGTGIKAPSKKSQRMAGEKKVASSVSGGSSGGNYVDAGDARGFVSIDQATKMLANPERYKMRPKEVQYLRGSMPIDMVKAPTEKSKIRTGDQFSPVVSDMDTSPSLGATEGSLLASANIGKDTKVASNAYSDASGDFNKYLNENYGFDSDSKRYKNIPGNMKRILKDSFNDDAIKFREGTQINQAPAKEKTLTERVADFTGNVVNTVTGTQSAVAQTKETGKGMFGGSVPEGTYSQFSPTSKPQYQVNREKNRPNQNTNTAEAGAGVKFGSVNLNAAKGVESPTTTKTPSGDTSFSSYVRGAGEGQERGNTRLAEARKIAKRNPNVSINKSTGKAEATNDSGRARAQAMAVNRKLSGRSVSQTKADNKASMRASAKERQATFKKTGKSTVSARRAKAKASMRAKAKKRHASFKKKQRSFRRNKRRSRRGGRGR